MVVTLDQIAECCGHMNKTHALFLEDAGFESLRSLSVSLLRLVAFYRVLPDMCWLNNLNMPRQLLSTLFPDHFMKFFFQFLRS